MNLLIPKCESSPKPFRVEHKLVGAESTKLSMSDCDTLTGSEVLKANNHIQCVCMWAKMYVYVCVCVCVCVCVLKYHYNNTDLHKIPYNTIKEGIWTYQKLQLL